jgi:hypothetical protein
MLWNLTPTADSYLKIKVNNFTYGFDATVQPEQRYTCVIPLHTGVLTTYQNYEHSVWDFECDHLIHVNEFNFTIYDGRVEASDASLSGTPLFIELELDD